MSADHDRTFVRTFLAVLGALVAFTFVIIVIARMIMSAAAPDELLPAQKARIENRTAPAFEVVTDPAQVAQAAQSTGGDSGQAADQAAPKSGSEVYGAVCAACHQAGVAGAPKTSDAAAWQARLDERGREKLYEHAINGFNAMPAKGGDPSLSDEEVKKAVDHMLEEAGV